MTKELAAALFAAQKELIELPLFKDSSNPHFGSRFLSLGSLMGQVLPVLHKHGLVIIQAPSNIEGAPALETTIVHAESGDPSLCGALTTVMSLVLDKNNPQGQGSAITYARRYALMSILGLVADEDDDGNAASPRRTRGTASNPREDVASFVDDGNSGHSAPPI